MKGKNLDIQFFKFLYSWIIVLYHLNPHTAVNCPGGSFGVEYYLLAAGVFLFASWEKQAAAGQVQTPGQYLWKRFSRFFWWSSTAFVFAAVVRYGFVSPVSSKWQVMDHFSSDIWEILMVKWNGMNENALLVNGPAWTLSSMCMVGFLLWGCLYFYRERFLQLFMPLSILIGYGFWRHLDSAATEVWVGFTTFGTLRTWLVMCLSYYCLRLSRKIAAIPWNRAGKILLTLAEIGLHSLCLIIIFNRGTRFHQWFVTLLMLLAITIALSGHSYLCAVLNRTKFADFLGEWSMSVFLIHAPVIQLFRWKYDMSGWGYRKLIPLFAVTLAASLIHFWLTRWLVRALPKLGAKLRKSLTQ